jgi:hypothetical protein
VNLGAALSALLRAYASRQREQRGELRLAPGIACDLAINVGNDAAKIGLELAQRAVGAVKLAGMGITLMHDQRDLGDADIGLAQLHVEPLGELDEFLAGPVHQLGIGREGDVLRLHGGVDDNAIEI